MFSADSRWALIRGSQGSEVWDLQAASSPVRAIEPFHAEEARFSPDGRRLISVAERGGPMIIRELATDGQRKVPVTWSEFHAFSSDGRLLAVDAAAGVALVDMTAGRVVTTFVGHAKPLHGVAFTPDGRILASVDANGSTILWDVTRARRLSDTLLGEGEDEDSINRIAFDAERMTLGGVPAHPVVWIEDLCRRIDPGLLREEWSRLVGSIEYPWKCDTIRGVAAADLASR